MNVLNDLLRGKLALVTGGSSGIGRATTLALERAGAKIIVIDRAAPDKDLLGPNILFRQTDLSDLESIPPMTEAIRATHGTANILVNCAGIFDVGNTLLTNSISVWRQIFTVNLDAPMMMMQCIAAQMMRDRVEGRIVNVTSSAAFRAAGATPAYSSSKAALTQLSRSAAAEFGSSNITVNCVAPGVTRTPMANTINGSDNLEHYVKAGPLSNLLQRISEPEDVAAVVRFLCLPESRQITAQTIHTSAGAIV